MKKRDKKNFEDFLYKLEQELPELITPEILVDIGMASHVSLYRIRKRGEIPFLKLSSARILYLKSDVIEWLKKCYKDEDST